MIVYHAYLELLFRCQLGTLHVYKIQHLFYVEWSTKCCNAIEKSHDEKNHIRLKIENISKFLENLFMVRICVNKIFYHG